jgi:hypothetical protein
MKSNATISEGMTKEPHTIRVEKTVSTLAGLTSVRG